MTRAAPAPERVAAIEWGVAARALPGEARSGDRHVVQAFPDGVLLAAMDGLGHGEEAATAAQIAARVLEERPHEPLPFLVQRCHDALVRTRGVALSLASVKLREAAVSWLGVGNVAGVLLRAADSRSGPAQESLLLRGGVVGYNLPPLKAAVLALRPGDTLIFATDGIRGDFAEHLPRARPQKLADRIMARHAVEGDDVLVLVARYGGRPR